MWATLTTDLHGPSVINGTVGGGKPSMENPFRVHVGHCPGNISGKREPKAPVQRDVFVLQHVIETAFWAVLAD